MICFRDMSFCADAEECANAQGCHRYFNAEQQSAAKRWWGGDDAPVAFMSFKETCEFFKGKK